MLKCSYCGLLGINKQWSRKGICPCCGTTLTETDDTGTSVPNYPDALSGVPAFGTPETTNNEALIAKNDEKTKASKFENIFFSIYILGGLIAFLLCCIMR